MISIMMASVLMVLTLSSGLTAMASTYGGDAAVPTIPDVEVSYVFTVAETKKLDVIYSIDLDIDEMKFTYVSALKEQWDDSTHTIKTVKDTEKTGWDKTSAAIKITNNSNVGLYVTMSYDDSLHGSNAGRQFTLKNETIGWINPTKDATTTLEVKDASAIGVPLVSTGTTTATVGKITITLATTES